VRIEKARSNRSAKALVSTSATTNRTLGVEDRSASCLAAPINRVEASTPSTDPPTPTSAASARGVTKAAADVEHAGRAGRGRVQAHRFIAVAAKARDHDVALLDEPVKQRAVPRLDRLRVAQRHRSLLGCADDARIDRRQV
jgi:hypothetical protein